MRYCLWAFLIGIWSIGIALAQSPQKIAEVYSTQVYAVDGADPDSVGTLIPAQLIVHPAATKDGASSITLEISEVTTVSVVRLTRFSLPPEYESVMGDNDEILLSVSKHFGKSSFDIGAIVAGGEHQDASYLVTVQNAAGQPATGIELTSRFGLARENAVALQTQVVPADGKVRLRMPRGTVESQKQPMWTRYGQLFLAAKDRSGQLQMLEFPQANLLMGEKMVLDYDIVSLAFLPPETTSTVYRGKVMTADGEPLGGVTLVSQTMSFPGLGNEFFRGQSPVVIKTAPDGTFRFGIPQSFLKSRQGVTDVPASATLQVRLPEYQMSTQLMPGVNNSIRVPELVSIRFQILDSAGNPVQADANQGEVRILKVSKSSNPGRSHNSYMNVQTQVVDSANAIYSASGIPVPGSYTVEINGLHFGTVQLESGRIDSLVTFRQVDDSAEVSGTVLSAENGTPLPGVFVLSTNDGNAPHILVNATQEDLEKALADWDTMPGKGEHKADIKVGKATFFGVNGFTRTDDKGEFRMDFSGGVKPDFIMAYLSGRMGARCDIVNNMNKADGEPLIFTLPTVYLPAAARVTVPIIAPDVVPGPFLDGNEQSGNSLQSSFMAIVWYDKNDFRFDVPGLNSSKQHPWKIISGTGWVAAGSLPSLPVPAGVKFSVTVSAPNHLTVGTANWSNLGPLAMGESIELPKKQVGTKMSFLVNVKKADGSPAVGVSVRIDGRLPLATDKDGSVIGWSSGHVERVEVMTDNTWQPAAVKRDITVSADGMTRVDLVIP